MADVKINNTLYKGVDTVKLPLSAGNGFAIFAYSHDEITSEDDSGGNGGTVIPSAGLLYSLPNETVFDGSTTFIDTGIQLAKEDMEFSIVLHVTCGTGNVANDAIFHCMTETNDYKGYAFTAHHSDANKMKVFDGSNQFINVPYNGSAIKMVITHQAGVAGVSTKYLYNGSVIVPTSFEGQSASHAGVENTLLLGCYQLKAGGEKGRFWNGTMHDFKIYNRVLSADEISAYLI